MRPQTLTPLVIAVVLGASPIHADNWPQWRGPERNGVSTESAPIRWSRTDNVLWRLELPGPAGSTPAIWGNRIFLTSAEGKDLVLVCVSTHGKERWKRKIGTGNKRVRGDEGNYASPSPSTDGQHVWTFMANGPITCHDVDGNLKWSANLQERYGKFEIQFGLSSTPVLDGDRIYIQLIHGKWNKTPSKGLVLALDKLTGKEIWRHVRATDAVDECKHSYASPILYRDAKNAFFVSRGADYVIGHSLKDGSEVWRCGGLNPKRRYNSTLRFVASPAAANGLVVVPTAKNGKVVAIEASAKGDVTDSKKHVRWVLPRSTPDVPSPLIHGGVVYLCRENGVLIALDEKSGEEIYQKRTVSDRHRASPVYAGGHVYLTARNGTITVVKAGRKFEIVAQNKLGEDTSSSPAISDGVLYVRTFKALYAIGGRKSKAGG